MSDEIKTMYCVAVVDARDDTVLERIGSAHTTRELERTERGVNINLNHADYYTEIQEIPAKTL
jgi:hypothetical protein